MAGWRFFFVTCAAIGFSTSAWAVPATSIADMVEGEPTVAELSGFPGRAQVWVVGSLNGTATDAGPCPAPAAGDCFDLVPPTAMLGMGRTDPDGNAQVTLNAPGLPAGAWVDAQVLVQSMDAAVPARIMPVTGFSVLPYVPGCMDPRSPDFDAAVTIDDGSCTYVPDCIGPSAGIYDAYDAAAYSLCTTLDDVYVHQISGVTDLDFPLLTEVTGYFYVHQSHDVARISAPNLQSVGRYVYMHQDLGLEQVDLSGLEEVGEYLYLNGNTSLVELHLDALTTVAEYVYLVGNSSLCVDPTIDWAPICADVTISGNATCAW